MKTTLRTKVWTARHPRGFIVFGIVLTCLGLLAASAPLLAQDTQALPPGITPQQVELWRELLLSGKELPPEAKMLLETRPDLKERLPADLRRKLEERESEAEAAREAARKPAPPGPQETAVFLPAYDWRTSTYVGGLFSGRLQENELKNLPHFGHDIFAPRDGATLIENVPVAPGYVIGPGDEVIVKLWGRAEGTYRMTVDRDGKIFLPKFGSLYVAGKTFEELKSFLKAKTSTIAAASSDVSLGQMKGIRISVVGEVQSPGWYNISSFHSALQALSLAGGTKDIGSLRSIKITRGDKEIGEIDLYDLLLRGKSRGDIRLLQGDTIFVPVVGKLVALSGEVRRPAIYELRDEKTLLALIRMAGGFAPSAYKQRVQVERLEGHTSKIVLDADAEKLEKEQAGFEIADGDIVRVLPIVGPEQNAVTLAGNVYRPGKYELKPGMTIGSLFKGEGDFLPDTYFDYALLTRLIPPDLHKEIVPVNLRDIVLEKKTEADVALQPRDTLKVFPKSAFRDAPKASISGEVRMARLAIENVVLPGTDNVSGARKSARGIPVDNAVLTFQSPVRKVADEMHIDNAALTFEIHAGARVADLVKLAGGLTRLAYLERAEILRVDENRNFKTIYFNLGKAMAGDPKENVLLEIEDQVFVHSVWETKSKKMVAAAGEVNAPGDYLLTDGMKLSDLLFRARGFKEGAYVQNAELVRRAIAPGGELVKTETVVVSPQRAMSGEADADVLLREYDILLVHQIPDWQEKIQVALSGEVRFPGVYVARKGERLGSVIQRAGGFTPAAYLLGAQFTRISTQKSQQEAIDKLVEELEFEVTQSAQATRPLDKEDIDANRDLMNARRALVEQLRKVKAKGRVIVRLADSGMIQGTDADIPLEDGDSLVVPKRMNVVNVVGRVYNPTGVVYSPANDRVGYYLRKVGGPTESADRDHIFLIKADGSVVTRENAGGSLFVFGNGGLMSAKVEPGDSIVVPEKILQRNVMKDFRDITQILYQIAVTAGVLIVVF
jgi:protein involved in polysaccharide export with SLBB domain